MKNIIEKSKIDGYYSDSIKKLDCSIIYKPNNENTYLLYPTLTDNKDKTIKNALLDILILFWAEPKTVHTLEHQKIKCNHTIQVENTRIRISEINKYHKNIITIDFIG